MGSKGKACEIGIFDSEEEAALRYDQVAISLGKTILNFSPAPIAPGQDSPKERSIFFVLTRKKKRASERSEAS